MKPIAILFPSDYFNKSKVDSEFAKEFQAVMEVDGLLPIVFGYDSFLQENKLILTPHPAELSIAVYRGWMMASEQYEKLERALAKRSIQLLTPMNAYALMHIFPNVASVFGDDTAAMKLYPLHEHIDIEAVKQRFVRFMVKDFVKSVKGTDFPRFFDQTTSQDYFDQCMELFYQYRGSLLTGGICIKEYLTLKKYGEHTNEYRVFYLKGQPISVCRNSGQGLYTPVPPMTMIERYASIDSPFYTVDYAEMENGTWKVIEAGDGGVSGLSDNQDNVAFFRAIAHLVAE